MESVAEKGGVKEVSKGGNREVEKFQYNMEYTEDQVLTVVPSASRQDEYLVADTPETEYWFKRSGHCWKLSHVWSHFMLIKKRRYD